MSDIVERLRSFDGPDGVYEMVYDAADEIERLRAWKAEAMEALARWDKVWEAAGCPGPLGGSKAENVMKKIKR